MKFLIIDKRITGRHPAIFMSEYPIEMRQFIGLDKCWRRTMDRHLKSGFIAMEFSKYKDFLQALTWLSKNDYILQNWFEVMMMESLEREKITKEKT